MAGCTGRLHGVVREAVPIKETTGCIIVQMKHPAVFDLIFWPAVVNDVLLVAANVCLIGSFAVFVLARVSLAADVYFIPVNYPASEATALHISIVGAVCYLVGIVTLIVEGFSAKN